MSAEEYSQGEDAGDPRIGLVLQGRYRIVRKIGSGGMGDVYEGVHELIGKKLAIKCMHADFAANQEAVARFKREARAATAVGNEHIVDVSDMGDLPDGSPFMVMEHLHGREFADLIENESPLPVVRVVAIVLEVLEALSEAHSSGVVHRDMKPENIFLIDRGGNPDFVKVLDFGISMISEHADAACGRMTQTGIAMGTPHYMSPEQARGDKGIDLRTDLYSVGVILYQALTNALPLEATSLAVLMAKILTEEPASMLEHRDDLPPSLDRIVLRAMCKEVEVRYESAAKFADALRPFLEPGYVGRKVAPIRKKDDGSINHATATFNGAGGGMSGTRKISANSTAQLPFLAGDPEVVEDAESAIPTERMVGATATPIPATATPVRAKAEFSDATLMAAGIAAPSHSRGTWVAVAGIAAVALIAAAVVAFLGRGGQGEAAPPPAVAKKTELAAIEILAPVAAAPQEVRVRITTVPAEAKVYLDGKPFPNGSEVAQPRSLAPVRVQVVLAGYRAIDDVAIFDKNRELVFKLQKSEVIEPPSEGRGLVPAAPPDKKGRAHRRRHSLATGPTPGPTLPSLNTSKGTKNGTTNDKKHGNKTSGSKTPGTKTESSNPSVYKGSQGSVRDDF